MILHEFVSAYLVLMIVIINLFKSGVVFLRFDVIATEMLLQEDYIYNGALNKTVTFK